MLTASSYRKLADLYHKNKYAAELLLRFMADYDLTTYKMIPHKVILHNYRLNRKRFRFAMKCLLRADLIELGPLVKYNSRKVRTIRIHPSALVTTESLTNFLTESAEREQRLEVAPAMIRPVKPVRKKKPVKVKKFPRPYIPPEVSVFDKLKPFYVEKF